LIGGSSPLDGSILGTTETHSYLKPAEVGQDPSFYSFSSENLLSSLQTTLGSIHLINHAPTVTSLLGAVLSLVVGLVGQILDSVGSVVGGMLGSLLDPLLNQVFTSLGISLANVDVGANLSCHPGQAQLVI